MGPVFEDICNQWLWRQMARDESAIEFDDLGRWWGNDPQRKQEAEIDIVGIEGTHVVLAGECKWRNEDFPASALEKLRHRTNLIGNADKAQLYAFSKTGFSQACRAEANRSGNVRLVSFSDMVSA